MLSSGRVEARGRARERSCEAQRDRVEQLGCRLVDSPLGVLIDVDAQKQTNVPGVYAAGDASVIGNITLASAEGVRAGVGIHHALVAEDSRPRPTAG